MAFTVCDCEHISWKPCHSSQLHFLPGSHRPVPVSCQRVHFGYSYAKYSGGVFPSSTFANAGVLVRLILPARRSQQGRRPAPGAPGRRLAKGSGKEERPLSAVFVFAHCCGNMRTGGKGLVYWALESWSAVRGCFRLSVLFSLMFTFENREVGIKQQMH